MPSDALRWTPGYRPLARRIATLLTLGPALDVSYEAVKAGAAARREN